MNIFSLFSSPKKIPDLLVEFCAKMHENEPNALQNFWKSLKDSEQTKALLLIRIFGLLQEPRVSQCLTLETRNVYQIKAKSLISDCTLILKYNLGTIKVGNQKTALIPLPSSAPLYSWRESKSYFDATKDLEYAKERLTYFVSSSEMPIEMAKALNLHTVNFLQPHLEAHAKVFNGIISTVYNALKGDAHLSPSKPASIQDKSFMTLQQLLLRHAACIGDSKFFSWMDEIANWALYQPKSAGNLISQFKLCHLIGISTKKILSKEVPPPKVIEYPLSSVKFNDSFQHYLIRKTLEPIVSYYPLSEKVYGALVEVFERSEDDRSFACFYWHVIKDLFQRPESPSLLVQFIHLTGNKQNQSLFERAIEILHTVTKEAEAETQITLLSLTCIYYLDYISHFKIPDENKKRVFTWIYKKKFTTASPELEFFPLSERLLKFIPFALQLKLMDVFIDEPPPQSRFVDCLRTLLSVYEGQKFYVSGLLEKGHERLDQMIPNKDSDIYKMLSSCLYFIHLMYHMQWTENVQTFLVDRLLNSTLEEKKGCVEDLKACAKDLNIQPTQVFYDTWLTSYYGIDNLELARERVPEEMDFKLKLISTIETFCHKALPFRLVFTLLTSSISKFLVQYIPFAFGPKLMDELVANTDLQKQVVNCLTAVVSIYQEDDNDSELIATGRLQIANIIPQGNLVAQEALTSWLNLIHFATRLPPKGEGQNILLNYLKASTQEQRDQGIEILKVYFKPSNPEAAAIRLENPEAFEMVLKKVSGRPQMTLRLMFEMSLSVVLRHLLKLVPYAFCNQFLNEKDSPIKVTINGCLAGLLMLYQENKEADLFKAGQALLGEKISKENPIYQKLELVLYFMHLQAYMQLAEEGQNILAEHLLNSTNEERGACLEDLNAYTKDLKIQPNQSLYEARLSYLKTAFTQLYSQRSNSRTLGNLLSDWPNSLQNFDTNVKSIPLIEKFCGVRLPLNLVVNLLLYPLFPKFIKNLELLDPLREEIYSGKSLSLSSFFISPVHTDQRDRCVLAILDSAVFPSHVFQGAYVSTTLLKRFSDISNFLGVALLPEPVHMTALAERDAVFLIENVSLYQNILSPFARIPFAPFHLQSWHKNEEGYLEFHLTLIRTMTQPESRHLKYPLEIPFEQLSQDPGLQSLLKVMIEELGKDTRNTELQDKLAHEALRLDFYLECFPDLSKAWKKYCKSAKTDCDAVGKAVLHFIRNVKVESRKVLARFGGFLKRHSGSLVESAAQRDVHVLEDGLSLLPPHSVSKDKDGVFQLKKTALIEEIEVLNEAIKKSSKNSSGSKSRIDNFCTLLFPNTTCHTVSACFTSLLIKEHVEEDCQGQYVEVNLILNTYNIQNPPSYSVKYKVELIHTPGFQNMLRWQILMLKSVFFAQHKSEVN